VRCGADPWPSAPPICFVFGIEALPDANAHMSAIHLPLRASAASLRIDCLSLLPFCVNRTGEEERHQCIARSPSIKHFIKLQLRLINPVEPERVFSGS
jgi:hypothetical protein